MSSHRRAILLFVALVGATCGGAPKPLPSGPPPEYEKPRGYDGGFGASTAPAGPAASSAEPALAPPSDPTAREPSSPP